MTKKIAFLASLILTCFCFSGCSNLFENLINEDLSFKKGDDSLLPVTEATGENAITSSGIVVIKNSEKNRTQILYNKDQKIYFVGKVPSGYSLIIKMEQISLFLEKMILLKLSVSRMTQMQRLSGILLRPGNTSLRKKFEQQKIPMEMK